MRIVAYLVGAVCLFISFGTHAQAPSWCEAVGPVKPISEVIALGEPFRKYEDDFQKFSELHWRQDGAKWELANYYDRAAIYYVWYCRTGYAEYLARANLIAENYVKNYLEPSKYAPVAHWSMMKGVMLHYLATGDQHSFHALGSVAAYFSLPYYMANLRNSTLDNRIKAKTLEAFLFASRVNAAIVGQPELGTKSRYDWGQLARRAVDDILASQDVNGAYKSNPGGVKPFMVGMLNDALIEYYVNFHPDPRILTAVKRSVDYLWEKTWDPSTQGFLYIERDYGGEVAQPEPGLNHLIVRGFGWVFASTGDVRYRERGDLAFAAGVKSAWLSGSKQFNQQYTSSYAYPAYVAVKSR